MINQSELRDFELNCESISEELTFKAVSFLEPRMLIKLFNIFNNITSLDFNCIKNHKLPEVI
jgi:hypothetical protein